MKKLLCILLAALSVFTLTACNKTDSLQTEVDALKQSLAELQATVSSQSEQISTLQGEKAAQAEKIAELESAKAAQAETIAALQNSANLSAEEIAALEAQLAEQEALIAEQERYLSELIPKGAFCSVQTAYANGWLTDYDVSIIGYYYNNRDKKEDVSNAVNYSGNIDALTLYAIKKTFIEEEMENSPRTVDDLYFGKFYGKYGKCYVLKLRYGGVPGTPIKEPPPQRDETIGGVVFKDYCEFFIYVWYPVEG